MSPDRITVIQVIGADGVPHTECRTLLGPAEVAEDVGEAVTELIRAGHSSVTVLVDPHLFARIPEEVPDA